MYDIKDHAGNYGGKKSKLVTGYKKVQKVSENTIGGTGLDGSLGIRVRPNYDTGHVAVMVRNNQNTAATGNIFVSIYDKNLNLLKVMDLRFLLGIHFETTGFMDVVLNDNGHMVILVANKLHGIKWDAPTPVLQWTAQLSTSSKEYVIEMFKNKTVVLVAINGYSYFYDFMTGVVCGHLYSSSVNSGYYEVDGRIFITPRKGESVIYIISLSAVGIPGTAAVPSSANMFTSSYAAYMEYIGGLSVYQLGEYIHLFIRGNSATYHAVFDKNLNNISSKMMGTQELNFKSSELSVSKDFSTVGSYGYGTSYSVISAVENGLKMAVEQVYVNDFSGSTVTSDLKGEFLLASLTKSKIEKVKVSG